MTAASLPELPDVHHLPVAVRSAERLRGSLVPCGPGLRPVAWPEVPRSRAAAITAICSPGLTAVLGSAAWVWGAQRAPHGALEVASNRGGAAAERFTPNLRVRDIVFRPGDRLLLGAVQVSSPARTVYDLLRMRVEFTSIDRAACRLLLRLVHGGAGEVAEQLALRAAPNRNRALHRLAGL